MILVMVVVAVVKMDAESVMLITGLVIAIKMSKNKSGGSYGSVNNCCGDGDDWLVVIVIVMAVVLCASYGCGNYGDRMVHMVWWR